MKQLELFEKPGAVIKPFPIERQRAEIRNMVKWLAAREGEKRNRYWYLSLRLMTARLQIWNVDEATIDRELVAFRDAVQSEINRQFVWGTPHDDEREGSP